LFFRQLDLRVYCEGLGSEPPAAEGQWGSGGETPSRQKVGVWGKVPIRRKQGGLGAEPLALGNSVFHTVTCIFGRNCKGITAHW